MGHFVTQLDPLILSHPDAQAMQSDRQGEQIVMFDALVDLMNPFSHAEEHSVRPSCCRDPGAHLVQFELREPKQSMQDE
jgi:hypothetical protein